MVLNKMIDKNVHAKQAIKILKGVALYKYLFDTL